MVSIGIFLWIFPRRLLQSTVGRVVRLSYSSKIIWLKLQHRCALFLQLCTVGSFECITGKSAVLKRNRFWFKKARILHYQNQSLRGPPHFCESQRETNCGFHDFHQKYTRPAQVRLWRVLRESFTTVTGNGDGFSVFDRRTHRRCEWIYRPDTSWLKEWWTL